MLFRSEVHQVREIRHPEIDKLIRLTSNPRGPDDDLIEVEEELFEQDFDDEDLAVLKAEELATQYGCDGVNYY